MTSRNEIYFQNKFKNLQNDLKPLNNYLHLSACDSTKSANTPRWKYSLNKYATKETLVNKKPLSPVTNIALVDRKKEQYPRMPVTNFEDEYYSNQISDDYVKLIRYGYKSDAQVQLNANLSDFQGKNVKFPSAENVHVDLLNTPQGSNFYGDNARKKMFSTFPSEKKERKLFFSNSRCFKTQLVNPTPINPLLRAKSVNSIDAEIKFANKDDTKKDLFNINNRLLFSDSGRNLNNDGRELSKQYAILQKMYHDWQDVVKGHEEIRVQGKKLNNEAVENFKNFQLAMLHQLNIVQELCNEFLQNEKSDIKNVTKSCSDQSTFENSDSSPPNKVDSLSKISSYKMYRLFLNGRYPSSSDGFYLLYLSFLEIIECDRWQSSSGAKEVLHHKSTSIINFDLSLVVCQSSENDQQLAIFPISGLCNGRAQCFNDAVIKEDQFTFCSNECLPKCGPHGACLKVGQKARCFCDNGYSGKYCTIQEPNECASRPCHFLAQCTNATGIFGCSCLDGFEGDGYNCTDINECELPSKQPLCTENSVCHNIPGSYFCDCATGYKSKNGLGGMCEDIDECEDKTHNCTSLEQCINTDGSFRCESRPCEIGFEKINGVCHDINECKTSNACSPDQSCINLIGSYKCIDQISAGQSKSTSKIDEIDGCLVNESCVKNASICHDRAVCLSQVDKCACTTGYEGNGIHCIDINECAKDKYICPSETNCINLDGGFTCCDSEKSKEECLKTKHIICKSDNECRSNSKCIDHHCKCQQGFHLNENLECIDIDECSSFSTICPEKNWCVNLPGSYVCCNDTASVSQCLGIIIYAPVQKGSTLNKKISAGSSSQQITVVPLPDVKTTPIPPQEEDCSLDPTICHESASCINKVCQCNTGFEGNGYICKDINECALHLDNCVPPLRCQNTIGISRYCSILRPSCGPNAYCRNNRCACKDGFILDNNACVPDPNNCSSNRMLCDPNATCINGKCTCSAGYIGDGLKCYPDPQDCHNNVSLCHQFARCIDRRCECIPEFSGDGITCFPNPVPFYKNCTINPSVCPTEAQCYYGRCVCKVGSTNLCNKTNLVIINEKNDCRIDPSICHTNAVCRKGICICKKGFIGNGFSCMDDPNDCLKNKGICSPNAICVLRRCKCKAGYVGNGISCVPSNQATTCSSNKDLCDVNAECISDKCVCRAGYLGDGLHCSADKEDCIINPSLCSANAQCISRRCVCQSGFIGNGKTCNESKSDPSSQKNKCENCDFNAVCEDNKCQCKQGFEGNGTLCYNNANIRCDDDAKVCGIHATCISFGTKMVCICNKGYTGNGRDLIKSTTEPNKEKENGSKETSTLQEKREEESENLCDSVKCGPNAECRINMSGLPECRCSRGFTGDGKECYDLNECMLRISKCHHLATCVNTIGSYVCQCPDGYAGDGVRVCSREIKVSNLNYIDTICEKNGITLQMTNRSDLYGKVYVKSQSENPDCSQTLPKKLNNSFKFTARFEKCDFKKEAEDTYSVIMVIQKHPSFITTGDEAYKLVCTYPSAEREVHESLSVETLNSSASYVEKSVGSKCILDVVDANTGKAITEATVGQKLQMKLRAESSGNYELYGTNCVVINMETGESFALTDEDGCAVEEEIFPNWKKMGNSLYSEFITFKWPETATVRFQCDCSVCAHQCPERKCNSKLKSPKKRSTASTSNAINNQNYVQSNILKIISDGNLENWDNYDNDKICVDGTIMSALFGFGVIFLVAALCALFFKQLANIRNDI
ncbi:Latent-transforming growth factor beta-binding protein 2 [Trichinella sp. T9]|nr:Latent-transforming growth factor beta-binding protein 2 [Trichinella sp. T9]